MADLTIGSVPVATGTHQIDDSTIGNSATTTVITGGDGAAVTPDTVAHGLAVTFNKEGFGEVDLWNLTPSSGDAQGFYFHQLDKPDPSTFLAAYWWTGGVELDLLYYNVATTKVVNLIIDGPTGNFTLNGSVGVPSINVGFDGGSPIVTHTRTDTTFTNDIIQSPSDSVTPPNNGNLMIQATSDTQITFKLKGSDGIVRSGSITLSP